MPPRRRWPWGSRGASSRPCRAWVALLIALLPLLFTGEALLRGRLYGPADLYATSDPWHAIAAREGAPPPANPILSDLAFANLPWRAAVRDAAANGRLPLWNRFVLAGNPLLGTAQAGVLHPATWLGLWLPVPLSFTFSCAFTLFLALLSAFLFFSDYRLPPFAALLGAVGWGFSTFVLFWLGWSVGPATATFPLLLLGLRRLAREPGRRAIGLTAAALWLSFCGGHPESFFHGAAAAAVYFLWELFGTSTSTSTSTSARGRGPAIGAALAAGVLALLLTGPQLLPLLEAIPHSAEYRARRQALARGAVRASPCRSPRPRGGCCRTCCRSRTESTGRVPCRRGVATARGCRWVTPARCFSRSPPWGLPPSAPRAWPRDLPGLPRGGAPVRGERSGPPRPGVASARLRPGPQLPARVSRGPRPSGLAAFGAAHLIAEPAAARRLVLISGAVGLALVVAFQIAQPVFADRSLPESFTWTQLLYEVVPVALLGLAALVLPARARVPAALVLLCGQRFLEMRGVYPTLPAEGSRRPCRVSRPRAATLLRASSRPARSFGRTARPSTVSRTCAATNPWCSTDSRTRIRCGAARSPRRSTW